jgi:hypothetical protein
MNVHERELAMTSIPVPLSASDNAGAPANPGWVVNEALIEQAVVRTVAYADIFDYPLTGLEVHRYLEGVSVTYEMFQTVLQSDRCSSLGLSRCDQYFVLAGREALIPIRRNRAAIARTLWPSALHYGGLLARLPFVRMVAVTGALAMDNVEPDADIDYLIVTEPERLWLCRALILILVKLAERRGIVLCPNYFLSEQALQLREQHLFGAHELMQMVPLAGFPTYSRMIALNMWTRKFLPNAIEPPERAQQDKIPVHPLQRGAEVVLRTLIGERIEQWERARKIKKFSRAHLTPSEAVLSADQCKGHFDNVAQRVLTAHAERIRKLEHRTL